MVILIEMKIKSELQDNYEKLLLSKDTLNDDNNILKEKLSNNENELIRLNELLNKKAEEDAKNKQNINLLMNQVGMYHFYPYLIIIIIIITTLIIRKSSS